MRDYEMTLAYEPGAYGYWGPIGVSRDGRIVGLEKATLKQFGDREATALWSDLHRVANPNKEPMLAEMVERWSGYIRATGEAVNDYSKAGYGGLAAAGHELTAQLFTPQDFHVSGDDTLPHYSGWQRWISEPTIETVFGGTTIEEEGYVFLGFVNAVAHPKAVSLKVWKGTEQTVVEPLNWLTQDICCKDFDPVKAKEMSGVYWGGCTGWEQNEFYGGGSRGLPVHELRLPIIIPPETTWHIDVKYSQSGSDALQPYGFRFRTAMAAWTLAF